MIKGAYIVPHPPIIIPEIGKGEERHIQTTKESFITISKDIAHKKPQTIVLITPHSDAYVDYINISPGTCAQGDFSRYHVKHKKICVTYDQQFAQTLEALAKEEGIEAGGQGEKHPQLDHGTTIPLYFINQYYRDYQLVRISISGMSDETHILFGDCIRRCAELLKRDIVIVASGDLSHRLSKDGPYGYAKEGPLFDHYIVEIIKAGLYEELTLIEEDDRVKSAQCGLPGFLMMSGAIRHLITKSRFLSYEAPFGVGYALGIIDVISEDAYVYLARCALNHYIETGTIMKPGDDIDEELLRQRSAVFVSIRKHGVLRGCIGTISPTKKNIAYEIIANAISAGTKDPRFPKIQKEELDELSFEVDVLKTPEPVFTLDELDVLRYGLIVSDHIHSALLLPNLKGIDTPYKQLQMALKKAGIEEDDFYQMERFEVVRHQ